MMNIDLVSNQVKIKIFKITHSALNLEERRLGVQKIEPVSGPNLLASRYFNYAVKRYNNFGKLLSPSEVGCTLSHLSIYKQLVNAESAALIFESDIEVTEKQLLKAISISEVSGVDFLHLGWHPNVYYGKYFRGRCLRDEPFWEVDHLNDFYGAFAYYITPKIAKDLISFHENLNRADAWAHFFHEKNYKAYFYGIFWHPRARGQLNSERDCVSSSVYNVKPRSLTSYLSFFLRQKLVLLDPRYRACKPTQQEI